MTRVDFYLIENTAVEDPARTACRLAHKAFRMGHRIYIAAADAAAAERLDQLLWTFSASSFIPHELNSGEIDAEVAVVIGYDEPPASFDDVLINLAEDVPPYFSRFARVAEIVAQDEAGRARARERFRFYRDRGYPLNTHRL